KTVAKDGNYECPRCKGNSWIRYPSIFLQTFRGVRANISSITMDQDDDNHSVKSDDGQEQNARTLAINIPSPVSDPQTTERYG
ncbi:unnamed protein product, partial [Allacma fusca]